jgi:hypothetical protein
MPANGLRKRLQQWIYTPKSGCSSAKNVVYLSQHLDLDSKIVRLWSGSKSHGGCWFTLVMSIM